MPSKVFRLLSLAVLSTVLVSCGENKPSASTPATSEPPSSQSTGSSVAPPSSSSLPPSTAEPEDYQTPAGRYRIFQQCPVKGEAYVIGTLIRTEAFPYSTNVNAYLLDGEYGYSVINVDSTGLVLGRDYMLVGSKKNSPDYGDRIDASGQEVVPMAGMEADYGVVAPIKKNVESLTGLINYPAVVDIDSAVLKNKDNITVTGSFDKQSFVADIGGAEVTVEALKSSVGGAELIETIYNLELQSSIGLSDLIVYSPTRAKVLAASDIAIGGGEEAIVEAVSNSLSIPERATNDLKLETEKLGAAIAWSSSDPTVISASGQVVRPAFGQPDASVVLTAVITCGSSSRTRTFNVVVPASDIDISTLVNPYISVYMEGSGSNKLIGIRNPTADPIDLAAYRLEYYSNGATSTNISKSIDYTIEAGSTVYIYNDQQTLIADARYRDNFVADNALINYNGDDAIVLKKDGVTIDIIGKVGERPANGWVIDGLITTKDHTLVRSSSVLAGSAVFAPAEWVGYACDNIDFLK